MGSHFRRQTEGFRGIDFPELDRSKMIRFSGSGHRNVATPPREAVARGRGPAAKTRFDI